MTILRTFLAALFLPIALQAQLLNHSLVALPGAPPAKPRALQLKADTIDVLALMVQFQTDTDLRTTGNGRFDTSTFTGTDVPIEAPPRNASYFQDHLTFLTNYYLKASKARVVIRPTLIGQTLTLSNVMAVYSPAKNASNKPVADLARDAWKKADSIGLLTDVDRYRAFIVFHAGIGRDIDMVSFGGYDPTPSDIPSLYLDARAFSSFHGTPGIPVRNGTFTIPNSIIMPETESRTVSGFGGDVLLEYSINGLLCASLGNFLGLPDLFDTKTGRSAIGRFGLMDGQGIFSFSGVFPPEPSAWEKQWLGWIEPIPVPAGTAVLQLPAVSVADSVYRIPIGPQEYYLVENRNRDPQKNGQRVTSTYKGITSVLTFARDTAGFNEIDITALSGNILDVEDLDWSLPGGVDDDGTFYDGGILIWHIDEGVIARNRSTNTINADPKRRGIDVEEADGSQDIGQEYGFLSAGSGSETGTVLDFWFKGNNSPVNKLVNKNEFTATSFPSTQSNDGAVSHVSMSDFSARGIRMTVQVTVGDNTVRPLEGFPKMTNQRLSAYPLTIARLGQWNMPAILVATRSDTVPPLVLNDFSPMLTDGRVYAWERDGRAALPGGFSNGRIARSGLSFGTGPSVTDLTGDVGQYVLVSEDIGNLAIVRGDWFRETNSDSLADPFFSTPLSGNLNMPIVVSDTILACAGYRGWVHLLGANGSFRRTVRVLADSTGRVVGVSRLSSPYTFVATGSDGTVALLPDVRDAGLPVRRTTLGHPIAGPAAVGLFSSGGNNVLRIAVTTTDGFVFLLDDNLNVQTGFPVKAGNAITAPPALADLDGDGSRDILAFSGNTIIALNTSGVVLDYFPRTVSTADTLVSAPIVGDVDGDGRVDVVGVTQGGLVLAYDRAGKAVRGFPLVAGRGTQSAAIFTAADSIFLAVASEGDGSVSAWFTGKGNGAAQAANYPWPQFQHDAQHSGIDQTVLSGGVPLSSEFFPATRAYNWPNPVYDGRTFIRYYVKENATVRVRIYDLAGDLTADLAGTGQGGVDNEIVWDVSGVQSGIYFARIEASGASTSGAATVKIAVVK
jgi:hypothetical protein